MERWRSPKPSTRGLRNTSHFLGPLPRKAVLGPCKGIYRLNLTAMTKTTQSAVCPSSRCTPRSCPGETNRKRHHYRTARKPDPKSKHPLPRATPMPHPNPTPQHPLSRGQTHHHQITLTHQRDPLSRGHHEHNRPAPTHRSSPPHHHHLHHRPYPSARGYPPGHHHQSYRHHH